MFSRAFAGKNERKRRAVLDLGEKGLKTVRTSVMNRVIMMPSGTSDNDSVNFNGMGYSEELSY
jgi:hypothetical protein